MLHLSTRSVQNDLVVRSLRLSVFSLVFFKSFIACIVEFSVIFLMPCLLKASKRNYNFHAAVVSRLLLLPALLFDDHIEKLLSS